MGAPLPEIPRRVFLEEIERCAPLALDPTAGERLWCHYQELRRWNPTVSLIGPGTRSDLVRRHYGESLAALPLLAPGRLRLVDLGSGGGFPGLVLAAARPELEVTLIEARERKWAFLEAASRRSALSCRCLNARVRDTLPEGVPEAIDVVTCRAVRLGRRLLGAIGERLQREGELLVWGEGGSPPAGWIAGSRVKLRGSERRFIQGWRPGRRTEGRG